MSGPGPIKPFEPPIMKIDRPHKPFGQHVDLVTPFGGGADKMRIGTEGQVLSHDLVIKGGYTTKI